MFDKIKKLFSRKDKTIKVSITVGDEVFEDITQEEVNDIIKELMEKLRQKTD